MANVVYVCTPSQQRFANLTSSHMDDDSDVPRAGCFDLYDFYEAKENQATTPFMPADSSSSTSVPTLSPAL